MDGLDKERGMTKQVAVVLAGCGVFDGSEIYETTLTLLRLDQFYLLNLARKVS